MPKEHNEISIRWSDEDQTYIAKYLSLDTVQAHGSSPQEALAELQIAYQLYRGTKK